jgi:hypothetical protein
VIGLHLSSQSSDVVATYNEPLLIYLFVSGICGDILYVDLKFVILILCTLLPTFLYKRHQVSGPKKMRDKSIRSIYDRLFIYCNWVFTQKICIKLGTRPHKIFIYLLQMGLNSEDLYKIRNRKA